MLCRCANLSVTKLQARLSAALGRTFFVTSVRARVFAPQIAANASLSFFGAKMPFLAFFMANAFLLPAALLAVLPKRRFSAVIFFNAA